MSSSLDQNGVGEKESGPILSSEDFLAFDEPSGLVLDFLKSAPQRFYMWKAQSWQK